MGNKKTAKKKAPVRKKTARTTKKNLSKDPNIYINIDQSKRSTKKSIGQTSQPRQPSVISTFTPMGAPSPSFIPFPLPTPNLNPFENVVKETQKAKIQEEPNGLEKPKPKEPEEQPQQQNEEVFEMKPNKPDKYIFGDKPEQQTELYDLSELVEPYENYKKQNKIITNFSPSNLLSPEEGERRRNKKKSGETDLSDALWFNPSRETDTPLEEQTKTEKKKTILDLAIYSDKYERPKVREGRSGIMTMNELIRPAIEEDNRRRDFQAFMSGGQRLGGDTIMDRLSQEELRRRRIDILDKDKKPLLITLEPSEATNVIEGEAQEGYKNLDTQKEERELEEYREYLKNTFRKTIKDGEDEVPNPSYLTDEQFKAYAKSKGIRIGNSKRQTLFKKLIDNYKTKN